MAITGQSENESMPKMLEQIRAIFILFFFLNSRTTYMFLYDSLERDKYTSM